MRIHLHPGNAVAAALTIAAKLVLLGLLVLVVIDPSWGHLDGKAPVARAITYPLWSLAVPAIWFGWPALRRRRRGVYPWMADLLVTLPCFTDVLGNRLDLYSRVTAFDDMIHFGNTAFLSAAVVLLTMQAGSPFLRAVERGVATGVTAALAWEVFEYVSFVTRSPELPTAYSDTLGDLVLGWAGSLVGPSAVAALWWLTRRSPATVASQVVSVDAMEARPVHLIGGDQAVDRMPDSSHSAA